MWEAEQICTLVVRHWLMTSSMSECCWEMFRGGVKRKTKQNKSQAERVSLTGGCWDANWIYQERVIAVTEWGPKAGDNNNSNSNNNNSNNNNNSDEATGKILKKSCFQFLPLQLNPVHLQVQYLTGGKVGYWVQTSPRGYWIRITLDKVRASSKTLIT